MTSAALAASAARHDLEPRSLSLGPAFGAVVQPDDHVHAAFVQVERMGMPLRAVADDGDGFPLEDAQVAVALIVDFCHDTITSCAGLRQFNVWV